MLSIEGENLTEPKIASSGLGSILDVNSKGPNGWWGRWCEVVNSQSPSSKWGVDNILLLGISWFSSHCKRFVRRSVGPLITGLLTMTHALMLDQVILAAFVLLLYTSFSPCCISVDLWQFENPILTDSFLKCVRITSIFKWYQRINLQRTFYMCKWNLFQ